MALKQPSGPVAWKRFTTNGIETYLGKPGEPIVDLRTGTPAVRLCDGLTPMGHPIGVMSTLTGVARPIIITPVHNSTDVDRSPVITASAFNGINADGSDAVHVASVWNVATDAAFTQMTYTSGESALNLTAIDLGAAGVTLAEGSDYYIRVAYKSDTGTMSDWSPTVKITTSSMSIGTVLPDGGIVFAQEGGDWLVVAPASQRVQRSWNDGYTSWVDTPLPNVSGTNGSPTTPNDPNSSEYNTDVLINVSQEQTAAVYCRSIGYDLPNAKDLQLIYNNRTQINAADSTGNLPTTYVWSSAEYNSYHAWYLNFSNGNWSYTLKYLSYWVVPFRRIPV